MSSNLQLENLNLVELDILLGHLRLGEGHLKKQLDEIQLSNLLSLGPLTMEQLINVSSNRKEKSGNVALVLNTVITSVFGAWMGFSGFMGLKLDSYIILFGITLLAVCVSLLVGYFSFKLTTQNAQSAIHNQRIHNIQLNVLKLVVNKQESQLSSLTKYLNNSLHYVIDKTFDTDLPGTPDTNDKPQFSFSDKKDYFLWLEELNKVINFKIDVIQEEQIYTFYSTRLTTILEKISESIELNYLVNPASSAQIKKRNHSDFFTGSNSFIKILSAPGSNDAHAPPNANWFKQNYLMLLAGIFPTLLGGFASMFVFLAGGPNLAKELGLTGIEHLLRSPGAQLIEFSTAVGLTLYYGISFIYNNYKSFIRGHEVDKTKRLLITLEKKDIYLKRELAILRKIKNYTKRIINIYTAIENINEFKIQENISEQHSLNHEKIENAN